MRDFGAGRGYGGIFIRPTSPGLSLLDFIPLLWSLGQVGYGIVNALLKEGQ